MRDLNKLADTLNELSGALNKLSTVVGEVTEFPPANQWKVGRGGKKWCEVAILGSQAEYERLGLEAKFQAHFICWPAKGGVVVEKNRLGVLGFVRRSDIVKNVKLGLLPRELLTPLDIVKERLNANKD